MSFRFPARLGRYGSFAEVCLILCFAVASLSAAGEEKESPASAEKPAPGTATVEAEVEGLLFYATDEAVPSASGEAAEVEKAMDAAKLADLRQRLAKAYHCTNFQLLGHHVQKVFKDYESWVVPSKELCLKVDSRGPAESSGINLHLQLWQDKKVLVKSDATLKADQPIFLGGPKWRKGRLVFVLAKN